MNERSVSVGDEVEAVGENGRYPARVVSVGCYGVIDACILDIYFRGPDLPPTRSCPWRHLESDKLAEEADGVFWRWPATNVLPPLTK